ncbi:MAG: hypothetical protein ACREMD_02905 [Gemmatimonadota bacterium]
MEEKSVSGSEYAGFFTEFFHDDPRYDVDDAMMLIHDNFPADFVAFWGLESDYAPEHIDPDDWDEYRRLYALSERLALAAQRLARPGALPEAQLREPGLLEMEASSESEAVGRTLHAIREVLSEIPATSWYNIWLQYDTPGTSDARARLGFFQTCMQLHALRLFHSSPRQMAQRMVNLLNYLSKTTGEGTQEYLRRVAACYVLGMRTEFAVMARAAGLHSGRRTVEGTRGHLRCADSHGYSQVFGIQLNHARTTESGSAITEEN